MEQKDTSQISAFDTLFSNNHIQMLKVLQSMSQYQEMMHTMELMKDFMPEGDSSSPSSMTDMLMGMLTPEQKQMFDLFSAMGDS